VRLRAAQAFPIPCCAHDALTASHGELASVAVVPREGPPKHQRAKMKEDHGRRRLNSPDRLSPGCMRLVTDGGGARILSAATAPRIFPRKTV